MNFKDMVAADIRNVFLNTDGFAEIRTIEYDGERYENIPIALPGPTQEERQQTVKNHTEGLFRVSAVLRCALSDLAGNQPKKGQPIRISDEDGFFHEYCVASSVCRMGMLRIGLEATGE